MGKYGDEGDKLLFKIQNSGDYFSGLTDEELLSRNAAKLASKFCEKGLRYDLTVPFARYVVMHRDEISFPFKRYQIQPVWRDANPFRRTCWRVWPHFGSRVLHRSSPRSNRLSSES